MYIAESRTRRKFTLFIIFYHCMGRSLKRSSLCAFMVKRPLILFVCLTILCWYTLYINLLSIFIEIEHLVHRLLFCTYSLGHWGFSTNINLPSAKGRRKKIEYFTVRLTVRVDPPPLTVSFLKGCIWPWIMIICILKRILHQNFQYMIYWQGKRVRTNEQCEDPSKHIVSIGKHEKGIKKAVSLTVRYPFFLTASLTCIKKSHVYLLTKYHLRWR